jgi:2-dehydro-3-deoxy-D-gluconate 5-dehydrogenase
VSTFDLSGRVALVTGGGRGLGRAMALALGKHGATVAVSSRSGNELDTTVRLLAERGARGAAIPWDLSDSNRVEQLVDAVTARHHRIDVLVHAAGHQVRHPALTLPVDAWDDIHQVHLRAAFLLARRAARNMMRRGEPGSILLIGSLTSWRVGVADTVAYAAAKSGLLGLMRTLAVEWAPHGIRVNTLAPGYFATDMTRDVANDPTREALLERIPLRREGVGDDLGGAVGYLAPDASAYVTGQVLTVDGGWSVA